MSTFPGDKDPDGRMFRIPVPADIMPTRFASAPALFQLNMFIARVSFITGRTEME